MLQVRQKGSLEIKEAREQRIKRFSRDIKL